MPLENYILVLEAEIVLLCTSYDAVGKFSSEQFMTHGRRNVLLFRIYMCSMSNEWKVKFNVTKLLDTRLTGDNLLRIFSVLESFT